MTSFAEIEAAHRANQLRLFRYRAIEETRARLHAEQRDLIDELVVEGPDEQSILTSIAIAAAEWAFQAWGQPQPAPQQPAPLTPADFPRAVSAQRPTLAGHNETVAAVKQLTDPEAIRAALRRGGPQAVEELRQQMHQMLGRPGASPMGDISTLSPAERARVGLITPQERAATLQAVRAATQPAQQATYYGRSATAGRRGLDAYEPQVLSEAGAPVPAESSGGTPLQKTLAGILQQRRVAQRRGGG